MVEVWLVIGADCTNAFEDVGHSASAYEMLKDFYIGELVESKDNSSCCATKTATVDSADSKKPPKSCQPCQ